MPHLRCVQRTLAVFAQLVFSLLIVTFFSFGLYKTLPQDSIRAQQLQAGLTVDPKKESSTRPLPYEFIGWVGNLMHGNLGYSIPRGQPVVELIKPRLFTTLVFSGLSLASAIFSIILLYSLLYSRSQRLFLRSAKWFEFISLLGTSLPLFLVIHLILVVLITTLKLNIHLSGWSTVDFANYLLGDSIDYTGIDFALPIGLSGFFLFLYLYILIGKSILTESQKDYVRTAQSKGLARPTILRGHILKNISFPLVAYVPYLIVFLVNGSLIIEIIFNIEGTGLLAFQSFQTRDVPVLMALLLLQATLFLSVRALSRISLLWLDPRLKGES